VEVQQPVRVQRRTGRRLRRSRSVLARWESADTEPESRAPIWFAVYKPFGGLPEVLIEKASASAMYERCTDHDKEQLRA
jgi:hypothetical protein